MKIDAYTSEGRARLEQALALFRKLTDPMRYDPARPGPVDHFVLTEARGRRADHSLDEVLEACEDLLDALDLLRRFDPRAADHVARSLEHLSRKRREACPPAAEMFQPPRGLAGKAVMTDQPLTAQQVADQAERQIAPDPSSAEYAAALDRIEREIRAGSKIDNLPAMLANPKAST